jgi:hypothetical protein
LSAPLREHTPSRGRSGVFSSLDGAGVAPPERGLLPATVEVGVRPLEGRGRAAAQACVHEEREQGAYRLPSAARSSSATWTGVRCGASLAVTLGRRMADAGLIAGGVADGRVQYRPQDRVRRPDHGLARPCGGARRPGPRRAMAGTLSSVSRPTELSRMWRRATPAYRPWSCSALGACSGCPVQAGRHGGVVHRPERSGGCPTARVGGPDQRARPTRRRGVGAGPSRDRHWGRRAGAVRAARDRRRCDHRRGWWWFDQPMEGHGKSLLNEAELEHATVGWHP